MVEKLHLDFVPALPLVFHSWVHFCRKYFYSTSHDQILLNNTMIPIISFRKCRKLAALIHSLLKFRRKSFELQPNLHLMKVLMSLRPEGNFTTRNTLEAYLYERSRQIEPSS
ncbi:hypothetical protein M3Y94_00128700 [Aphelenchoides besseyi]|nr:hypothetical protein M3Y94_00128700 [Aphelenchoides besseyi]